MGVAPELLALLAEPHIKSLAHVGPNGPYMLVQPLRVVPAIAWEAGSPVKFRRYLERPQPPDKRGEDGGDLAGVGHGERV